jgi:hypothetical protein
MKAREIAFLEFKIFSTLIIQTISEGSQNRDSALCVRNPSRSEHAPGQSSQIAVSIEDLRNASIGLTYSLVGSGFLNWGTFEL